MRLDYPPQMIIISLLNQNYLPHNDSWNVLLRLTYLMTFSIFIFTFIFKVFVVILLLIKLFLFIFHIFIQFN